MIPFDITFRIVTQADHDHGDGDDEDILVDGATNTTASSSVPQVSAHRLVLGLTSPVFRSQLYGRWKEGGEQVIEVKDVTFPAFRTMVNYIYGVPLSYSVEFLTLEKAQELFDIVYAAKKYLIPQLLQEIVALINKAAITTNTIEVQELVKLAGHYSHLEEASVALLAKCEEEMEDAKQESKRIWEKEEKEKHNLVTVHEIVMNEENFAVDVEVVGEVDIDIEPMPPLIPQPLNIELEPMLIMLPHPIVEIAQAQSEDGDSPEELSIDEVVYYELDEGHNVDMVNLFQQNHELDQVMEEGQLDDSLVNHADQIDLGS